LYVSEYLSHTIIYSLSCRSQEKVRETIIKAAPESEEAIKYGIPTFVLSNKNLVHFAGYKTHIGFS